MKKGEELIALLKANYKDDDFIESFIGECRYGRENDVSSSGCFTNRGKINISNLWYDEENDTLATWGWGLLLLYKEGKWASHKLNSLTQQLYEIY